MAILAKILRKWVCEGIGNKERKVELNWMGLGFWRIGNGKVNLSLNLMKKLDFLLVLELGWMRLPKKKNVLFNF